MGYDWFGREKRKGGFREGAKRPIPSLLETSSKKKHWKNTLLKRKYILPSPSRIVGSSGSLLEVSEPAPWNSTKCVSKPDC